MNRWLIFLLVILGLLGLAAFVIYRTLPIERVGIRSDLIMLGDLNGDNAWSHADTIPLQTILANPFQTDKLTLMRLDVNRNGMIDAEDTAFLGRLYLCSNPYQAEDQADSAHIPYPRPREFFRYLSSSEYLEPPVFTLTNDLARQSPLACASQWSSNSQKSDYQDMLQAEVYSEALRFTTAYRLRDATLSPVERSYADDHIKACNQLYKSGENYQLLLSLIGLVEDAETLRYEDQTEFVQKILYFRDHLRDLLTSPAFHAFESHSLPCDTILRLIELNLRTDLQVSLALDTVPPPRNFLKLENYIDRIEWQKYKSKSTKAQFEQLLDFAQTDRRYLRAVSKTSRKHDDRILENHNLPMILLFREALRICNNDKKAAVGLLDEALRIPFSWIKSIPRKLLPPSVALENFLLPGNMEDGSDKSRHWNVFGGIALYRSPKEALVVALEREVADLKEAHQSVDAMTEFIRDMIADINGIYYVMSINPDLLKRYYHT